MKHATLAVAALVLLVLFPTLPHDLATLAAPALVWTSTQPILVGFALGAAAWPHLKRAAKTAPRTAK